MNLPPRPLQSSLAGRIGIAIASAFSTFLALGLVLFVTGLNKFMAPVPGLLALGIALYVLYITPGKILEGDWEAETRWQKKCEDIGRAQNPETEGKTFEQLLARYPDWPEMIAAIHANPAYAQYIRGDRK